MLHLGHEISSSAALTEASSLPAVIIETRAFIRDCMALSLTKALSLRVLTYSNIANWSDDPNGSAASVIILGKSDNSSDAKQIEIVKRLSEHDSTAPPLVMIAESGDRRRVSECLRSGIRGFITSDTPLDVVASAIKLILAGGTFVPAHIFVLDPPETQIETEACIFESAFDFTLRENEVLKELLKGKSNKIIAYELSLSESSVKVHVHNLMKKLHVRNRTEAVVRIAELFRARRSVSNGEECAA